MNSYRMLGEQTGTAEARDLAVQLQTWHDAMVMHLRAADRRGAPWITTYRAVAGRQRG